MTWDAVTGASATLHATADWNTGRALCGAYVAPIDTTLDPTAWRPRCRRCTAKETQK
jgi:hypothetical protein